MILPDSICQHMFKLKDADKPVTVHRHSYLYYENDAADTVYMLEHGMIMLTKLMPNGHEVGIILLSGKNLFAHCEVLSCSQREHQAMALTTSKVWTLSAKTFLQETRKSSEFAMALAHLQNERLRHVENHIRSISQENVTRRLTSTLLDIARSYGCDAIQEPRINPCPTHQDLAVMISSTRETVSMIMNKLRKQNLITFDRKEIKILNKELLLQY